MSEASQTEQQLFQFDDFELDVTAFELRQSGELVPLEPQVFILLAYLVQHRDRLVTKDELLDELWGHRFVSESALATRIKVLRKAVGDDGKSQRVIKTTHGRGYRFVADLIESSSAPRLPKESSSPQHEEIQHNLPRERSPLFGRRDDLNALAAVLQQHRLVSILGIGGTGKTRLSIALGRMLLEYFPDGVWFIDLIPVTQGDAIDDAIANVTRLALNDGDARRQVVESFRDRRMLVILDNCEHIKEEVAGALDYFLDHTDAPRFLLTSRDPVNLIDERRYFLEPLSCVSGRDVSPAAQLFVSTAERHGVRQMSIDVGLVENICRQLDGLPLAIELAAAQLRHLSVEELSKRLDRRFQVLNGRHSVQAEHQSNLSAVLEDTWKLLNETEQRLLMQLAAFPGQFTMADVEELLSDEELDGLPMAMSRLVELCLLSRGAGSLWRLLETVREFARNLQDPVSRRESAKRHADWCIRKLGKYPDDHLNNLSQAAWCLEHYDDLKAAEEFLVETDRLEDAMFICCAPGLMIQLDDGARSRHQLERSRLYLDMQPSKYWQAKLHAMAGLSGQGIRAPKILSEHTASYSALAQELDDPLLLANALIMRSLTAVFEDGDRALGMIDEAITLSEKAGSDSNAQSARSFRAWHLAVLKRYDEAVSEARGLIEAGCASDNPILNATNTIITCLALNKGDEAQRWIDTLSSFPAVADFWVVQLLRACAGASTGNTADSANMNLIVGAKLRRAGKDEFPETAIPACVIAYHEGESDMVRRWLTVIRNSRRTIQTYHMIIIYRQLYAELGFDEDAGDDVDAIKSEIADFLATHAVD